MPENDQRRQRRSMITIGLPNISDDKVIAIKQKVEELLSDYPDAVLDLRIGSMPSGSLPPGPPI